MTWLTTVIPILTNVVTALIAVVGLRYAFIMLNTKKTELRIAELKLMEAAGTSLDATGEGNKPGPSGMGPFAKQPPSFFRRVIEPLLGFAAMMTSLVGFIILQSDTMIADAPMTLGNAALLAQITALFLYGAFQLIMSQRH